MISGKVKILWATLEYFNVLNIVQGTSGLWVNPMPPVLRIEASWVESWEESCQVQLVPTPPLASLKFVRKISDLILPQPSEDEIAF